MAQALTLCSLDSLHISQDPILASTTGVTAGRSEFKQSSVAWGRVAKACSPYLRPIGIGRVIEDQWLILTVSNPVVLEPA